MFLLAFYQLDKLIESINDEIWMLPYDLLSCLIAIGDATGQTTGLLPHGNVKNRIAHHQYIFMVQM